MQVEELGLFSGGKCNSAVEDKFALEVYSLFIKFKKELNRCIEINDYDILKIDKNHFESIQRDFNESDLRYLMPKFAAISDSILIFESERKFKQYRESTTQCYIAVLVYVIEYLKSLIFQSYTSQLDLNYFMFADTNFVNFSKTFTNHVNSRIEMLNVAGNIFI